MTFTYRIQDIDINTSMVCAIVPCALKIRGFIYFSNDKVYEEIWEMHVGICIALGGHENWKKIVSRGVGSHIN